MPNSTSAKKTLRQSVKRAARNAVYKKKVKTVAKNISALLDEKKQQEAVDLLPSFYKAVDKARKHHVLHKNTAARRKAIMARRTKDVASPQATTAAESNSQAK